MAVHADRSLRLPQPEYFPDPHTKSGIALHHTWLLAVDSLRLMVATLQDSVLRLEMAHAAAYGAASASYQDLTRRYIAELNKPRVRLPSLVGFVGAVGVVGRVIR